MMGCAECVDDVEAWRVIKLDMPEQRPAARIAARKQICRRLPTGAWPLRCWGRASWARRVDGSETQRRLPTSIRRETVVFNVPSVTRGDVCNTLQLATDTQLALLRVPGVSRDLRVVALDSEMHELPASRYGTRIQPDGSQLVHIDSQLLKGRTIHLEARGPDGSGEPLGCVAGETPPSGF